MLKRRENRLVIIRIKVSDRPVIVCKKINFLPYKMRIVFQTDPEMNNLKLIFTVSLQFLILKNIRDRV